MEAFVPASVAKTLETNGSPAKGENADVLDVDANAPPWACPLKSAKHLRGWRTPSGGRFDRKNTLSLTLQFPVNLFTSTSLVPA